MIHVHRLRATAVALTACATVALLGGCAAGAPSHSAHGSGDLVVRDKANGHTVTLKVGDRLELVLASSYWTVRGSSVPGVLRQSGQTRSLAPPPGCGSIPGTGCVPIRTDFSAVAPGTAKITASRLSCGEALRCSPSQQHFALTVIVR